MTRIFVTGGSGFIGSPLCGRLSDNGFEVTVLSRTPEKAQKRLGPSIQCVGDFEPLSTEDYSIVINLAGLPIAGRRWTDTRKAALRFSRIHLTEQLVDAIRQSPHKPKLLISGSAIGYYGDCGNTLVDEASSPHPEYTHELCRDWENAALRAEEFDVRVCLLRLGLVIGDNGGFLQQMLPAFKLGLGGKMGNGQQWMSWVHRQDVIRAIVFLIENNSLEGAFNVTAPNPARNIKFTKILASILHRPSFATVPSLSLKLLFGEMAGLLLTGQRVIPKRLQNQGFEFHYDHLEDALNDAIMKKHK